MSLLLLPPTPLPTLFPYTTLFRSQVLAFIVFLLGLLACIPVMKRNPDWPNVRAGGVENFQAIQLAVTPLWVDRKGTRLNSSHLGISYAVFCLKKKNAGKVVATDAD